MKKNIKIIPLVGIAVLAMAAVLAYAWYYDYEIIEVSLPETTCTWSDKTVAFKVKIKINELSGGPGYLWVYITDEDPGTPETSVIWDSLMEEDECSGWLEYDRIIRVHFSNDFEQGNIDFEARVDWLKN